MSLIFRRTHTRARYNERKWNYKRKSFVVYISVILHSFRSCFIILRLESTSALKEPLTIHIVCHVHLFVLFILNGFVLFCCCSGLGLGLMDITSRTLHHVDVQQHVSYITNMFVYVHGGQTMATKCNRMCGSASAD